MSALTIIKHIGESPSQCTKPRKGNKGPQLRKEETKLFQFLYAMIVSVRNPMEFIHTHKLDVRSEFSKVTGYKTNIFKNLYFCILAMNIKI